MKILKWKEPLCWILYPYRPLCIGIRSDPSLDIIIARLLSQSSQANWIERWTKWICGVAHNSLKKRQHRAPFKSFGSPFSPALNSTYFQTGELAFFVCVSKPWSHLPSIHAHCLRCHDSTAAFSLQYESWRCRNSCSMLWKNIAYNGIYCDLSISRSTNLQKF